jgi:hypothetical protein
VPALVFQNDENKKIPTINTNLDMELHNRIHAMGLLSRLPFVTWPSKEET